MKSQEKMKLWYNQFYDDLQKLLFSKKAIMWINSFTAKSPNLDIKTINDDWIKDDNIISFYEITNGWKVSWETKKTKKMTFDAEGTINILPLEEIFADHWDESWADTWEGTEIAEDMVGFRPLDSFYEGAGIVGFYINRTDKKALYLYKEEGEPEPLHVDFEGYLKLLTLSKGFGWWQNALVQINTGVTQPNVADFKENMPKIFPEFNWEEFVALYESVRIDK